MMKSKSIDIIKKIIFIANQSITQSSFEKVLAANYFTSTSLSSFRVLRTFLICYFSLGRQG